MPLRSLKSIADSETYIFIRIRTFPLVRDDKSLAPWHRDFDFDLEYFRFLWAAMRSFNHHPTLGHPIKMPL